MLPSVEINQIRLGSGRRLHLHDPEHGTSSPVGRHMADLAFGRDLEPGSVAQKSGLRTCAHIADILDVIRTAGHGIPAEGKIFASHGSRLLHFSPEADCLAVISLRMVPEIHVEDPVVHILKTGVLPAEASHRENQPAVKKGQKKAQGQGVWYPREKDFV